MNAQRYVTDHELAAIPDGHVLYSPGLWLTQEQHERWQAMCKEALDLAWWRFERGEHEAGREIRKATR